MAVEQFANNAQTTLAAAVTTTVQGTVTVTSAAAFPTAGNFRILIDSELMLVTAVAGNVFTVSRNVEGTSPTTHAVNANVTQIVTSGGIVQARTDGQPLFGTAIGSAPASAATGQLAYWKDSPVAQYWNGSAWVDGLAGGQNVNTAVVSGNFSWINQGTSSFSTSNGGLLLNTPFQTSGTSLAILEQSFTNTQTTTALLCITGPSTGFATSSGWFAGMTVRRPGSGTKIIFAGFENATTFIAFELNSPTSVFGTAVTYGVADLAANTNGYIWLRRRDDGTTQYFDISPNGLQWVNMCSFSDSVFLGGVPTTVGIGASNFTSSGAQNPDPVQIHLVSWKVG